MKLILMLFCFFCGFSFSSADASSVFLLNRDGSSVVAKRYGSVSGIGYVIINPRNQAKNAFGSELSNDKWISKYGSVTFNHFLAEMPVGGINEKGLVIDLISAHDMNLMNDNADIELNEFETVQYLLDNYDSVDQVAEAIKNINIRVLFHKFHYFVADKTGKSAVIEFVDGKVLVIDDKNPSYLPILSKTRYLKSISAVVDFKPRKNLGDEVFSEISRIMTTLDTTKSLVTNAKVILSEIENDDTKWNVMYDLTNDEIIFNSNNSPLFKTIKLDEINFSEKHKTFINVNVLARNLKFKQLYSADIRDLIKNNMSKFNVQLIDDECIDVLVDGTLSEQRNFLNERNKQLGTLRVNVSNLDSDRGVLRVALYDTKAGFDNDVPCKSTEVVVFNNKGRVFFYNLMLDKEYSIFYFHDENTNGKIDRQWVGLPKEDFGFSGSKGDDFETTRFKLSDLSFGEYNIENSSFLIW